MPVPERHEYGIGRYRTAAGQIVSVATAVKNAGIETRIRAYISLAALRHIVYMPARLRFGKFCPDCYPDRL